MKNKLQLIENDPYLAPYSSFIEDRLNRLSQKKEELQIPPDKLSDFACGHLYFGLHKESTEWVFREYAPNASSMEVIVGAKADNFIWQPVCRFSMKSLTKGEWELRLPIDKLDHGDLYRLKVYWGTGSGYRLSPWSQRIVQDPETCEFSTQVWDPSKAYIWKKQHQPIHKLPLIYETHVGMSVEEYGIGTFDSFRRNVLPRIKKAGYNTIQIMGIQEHPYYASFGYHVSNFFAISSRFGTPEELKELIDAAHEEGISVLMDIVHSHAANNELEGLNHFDGDLGLYFYPDFRREHPQWGSLCFDYNKGHVIHLLLSNCKYWIEEFHFDGFRFDGVSSMLYNHHGLGIHFSDYSMYFTPDDINYGAIVYLQLANELIHTINPMAITIAEEMSGMPGIAFPIAGGGIGFDYRLAMGIPDYWVRTIDYSPIGNWNTGEMYYELTQKRIDEKTVSYVESHDQALVGDQTVIFRLLKERIYDTMSKNNRDPYTLRAIQLHKMIRLVTLATAGNGYLNFMGNEFGHPEWIDFPREGNNWSYHYARRQWSLFRKDLKYYELGEFDKKMVCFFKRNSSIFSEFPTLLYTDSSRGILAFKRKSYLFLFNFGDKEATLKDDLLNELHKYTVKVAVNTQKDFGGKKKKYLSPDTTGLFSEIIPPVTGFVLRIIK